MSSSLRDLLMNAGLQGSPESPEVPQAQPKSANEPAFAAKVVLRRSKKGRCGKVATTLEGVTSGHQALVDQLKRELGTGGHLEGDLIVLGGDQIDRLRPWLERRGVKKVVVG
jgi:translation initiation factor 1 (eIF-1/SUI1)